MAGVKHPADDESRKEELQKALAAATRQARMRLGLSQEAVAQKVGVRGEFLSRIERGTAMPSVPTFHKLAHALQVSADELIGTNASTAGSTRGRSPHKSGENASPPMSPEMRRLVRRLRNASPGTIRLVSLVVKELEGC